MKKITLFILGCLVANFANSQSAARTQVRKIDNIVISKTIDTLGYISRNRIMATDTAANPYLLKNKGAAPATADIMPAYPGGATALNKDLKKYIVYPAEAVNKRYSGTVQAQFIVNSDGSLARVGVMSATNSVLTRSVIKAIEKCSAWVPGRTGGKASRVRYDFKVEFVLNSTLDKRVDNLNNMESKVKKGISNANDARRYFNLFPHTAKEMQLIYGYEPTMSNLWGPYDYWIEQYYAIQEKGYISQDYFFKNSIAIAAGLGTGKQEDLIGLFLDKLKEYIKSNFDTLAGEISSFSQEEQDLFWGIVTQGMSKKEIKSLHKTYKF